MQLLAAMDAALFPKSRILNPSGFPIQCLILAMNRYKLGIAVIDKRFRFTALNRELAEMNNLAQEVHVGKQLHNVLGHLSTEVELSLEGVFKTGELLPNILLVGHLPTRPDPVQFLQYFCPLVGKGERVAEVCVFVMEKKPWPKVPGSLDPMPHSAIGEGPLDSSHAPDLNARYRPELTGASEDGVVLSARQLDVLRLLATGKGSKEISSVLAISVKTVETYRVRMMAKIHVRSLADLVHYAIRHKIVDLQQ